jgi:hypothetical protein
MSPQLGVEVSQSLYGTPAERAIEAVQVFEGPDVGPKVEGSTGEDALDKISTEIRHLGMEWIQMSFVVVVNVGRPQRKRS